jgi:hypothetical protein
MTFQLGSKHKTKLKRYESFSSDYRDLISEFSSSKPAIRTSRKLPADFLFFPQFRCERDVTHNGPILPLYHLSSQTPEELSCSLMLTLAPWCSVINSTGYLVKLKNLTSTDECLVEVNDVAMPFYINVSCWRGCWGECHQGWLWDSRKIL